MVIYVLVDMDGTVVTDWRSILGTVAALGGGHRGHGSPKLP